MSRQSIFRLLTVGIFSVCMIIANDHPTPVFADNFPPDSPFLISILADVHYFSIPSAASQPIGVLPLGTAVPAIARTTGTTWILVEYNGRRGWVSVNFILSPDGDLVSLPVSTGNSILPGAGEGVVGTAAITMSVRSGPGIGFQRLGILSGGESVILDGRSGFWIRYRFNNQVEGWVSRSFVYITGSLSSLPIVQ